MKICWDNLNKLRYNKKTGKWYKDRYKNGELVGTNSYELNEDDRCQICNDWFFYATGNQRKFCSLSCTTIYRNSIIPISEATKLKIGKGNTGKKRTEEQKAAMKFRPQNQLWKGSGNPSWKGGIETENSKIYHSTEYKEWRLYVFERDSYTCQMCGKKGGRLEAHHIKIFSKFRHLVFVKKNGITLCRKCHRSIRKTEEEYEEMFIRIVEEKE